MARLHREVIFLLLVNFLLGQYFRITATAPNAFATILLFCSLLNNWFILSQAEASILASFSKMEFRYMGHFLQFSEFEISLLCSPKSMAMFCECCLYDIFQQGWVNQFSCCLWLLLSQQKKRAVLDIILLQSQKYVSQAPLHKMFKNVNLSDVVQTFKKLFFSELRIKPSLGKPSTTKLQPNLVLNFLINKYSINCLDIQFLASNN